MSIEPRFPTPSESSKQRVSVRRFSRAGASTLAATLVAGSAIGLAALPSAQAETAPAAVVAPAAAPDGILGSFSAVAPGLNNTVYSLEITDDTLFVGGKFTSTAHVDDSFVTSWSLADDTFVDLASSSLFCSTTANTSAYALSWRDDTLYVGGAFTAAGGVAGTKGVATLTNGNWGSLAGGLSMTNCDGPEAFEWNLGTLYVAGSFDGVPGLSGTDGLAYWRSADDTWGAFAPSLAANSLVYSLSSTDDSLFVGGSAVVPGGQDVGNLAQWSFSDAAWSGLRNDSSSGFQNFRALASSTTTLFAGGNFTSVGGVPATNIAAWSYSDDTWTPIGPGLLTSGSAYVYQLEVDDAHQILYAGGTFTYLSGSAANSLQRVAAFDIQTSTWIPFSYSLTNGVNGEVRAFAFDDSAVYLGGAFTDAGGISGANKLARWTWDSPQGSVDDTVSVDDTNIAVAGEGFIGVQAVTLDDTSGSYPVSYTIDDTANITITSLGSAPGGSTYDINVDAVGGIGTVGTLNVNPTAPSAPQTPAASAGNASATVTWTAPASSGGAAITQYDVTSSPGGLTCSVTPPTTSCVVRGLTNGTAYTFDITATNAIGTSTAATTSSVTPVNPTPPTPPTPTKPSAPTNVSGVAGDGQVAVTWQAPADSGSYPITDYQVTASPGGATCLVAAPTLACTVDGLTNGTAYTFTVKALSGAGWGANSAPSAPVTPQAPRNPTITITGSRSQDNDKRVYADGITTDLVGEIVQARVHLAGEEDYYNGSRRTVSDDGTFRWTRKTNKKVYLYFRHDETRSNRIVISPR